MDTTLPALKKFRGRHFLTDLDYTREELEDLLKLAVNLKACGRSARSRRSCPASTWR